MPTRNQVIETVKKLKFFDTTNSEPTEVEAAHKFAEELMKKWDIKEHEVTALAPLDRPVAVQNIDAEVEGIVIRKQRKPSKRWRPCAECGEIDDVVLMERIPNPKTGGYHDFSKHPFTGELTCKFHRCRRCQAEAGTDWIFYSEAVCVPSRSGHLWYRISVADKVSEELEEYEDEEYWELEQLEEG